MASSTVNHRNIEGALTPPEATSRENLSESCFKTVSINNPADNTRRDSKCDVDTLSENTLNTVLLKPIGLSTKDTLTGVNTDSSDMTEPHKFTLEPTEVNPANDSVPKALFVANQEEVDTSQDSFESAGEDIHDSSSAVSNLEDDCTKYGEEISIYQKTNLENPVIPDTPFKEEHVETSEYKIKDDSSSPAVISSQIDTLDDRADQFSSEEETNLRRDDNSTVGMFKRFTSTFSLRNSRGTFASRESIKTAPALSNLSNRNSGKSSLSDDSSNSDSALVTPNGLHSHEIPDSFSLLDGNSSITSDLLISGIDSKNKAFGFRSPISNLKGLIDEDAEADIDWEFWGMLISDYPGMVRKQSRLVSKNIQSGIPSSLRGPIWQLISKSKDSPLEVLYNQLLEQISPFDKMITRDLSRTFPNHEFFQNDGEGQESLYNVVKAFSLYDTDVGYCQGIPFIVGPLLLHMPEEEAFCVLVRLMRTYGLRGHFTPQMETLHLRLYQFDHLLEEYLPNLHKHMLTEGITSSMYASQWFMTLFAYRFPLPLVFRIFDIIFAEGVESLLRFAIALLKANHSKLIDMPFETLLDFLKHHIYHVYDGKIDQLVNDAYDVKITTKRLDRLSRDYHAELKKQQAEGNLIESLKVSNKRLEDEIKILESNVQTLNEEHCELANEFVQCKLDIANLQDENESLKFEVTQLKEQLEQSRKEAEQSVKQEMELLAHKNLELADRNTSLEDQLSELEAQLIETKMNYAESENERVQLQKKWDDLRRAFH